MYEHFIWYEIPSLDTALLTQQNSQKKQSMAQHFRFGLVSTVVLTTSNHSYNQQWTKKKETKHTAIWHCNFYDIYNEMAFPMRINRSDRRRELCSLPFRCYIWHRRGRTVCSGCVCVCLSVCMERSVIDFPIFGH